ncbi:hypothetical protein [Microscilla marina]|uniref:Uncharacterized protein n=1 Tax=Microscilla marina ATCC 23134 TaxID=313606 RepID=A1ZP89_MICM2|nr:hypothetical protein [Microscilla marina]EAY27881.1 hypothetical protein M23134_00322 [Microscilla marina ATCC 23134]
MVSYISLLFIIFICLLFGSSLFAEATYPTHKLALPAYPPMARWYPAPLFAYRSDKNDTNQSKSYREARDSSPIRDEYVDSLDPKATIEYIIDYCKSHPSPDGYEVGLIYFVQMVASKVNTEEVQQLKVKAIALLNQKIQAK